MLSNSRPLWVFRSKQYTKLIRQNTPAHRAKKGGHTVFQHGSQSFSLGIQAGGIWSPSCPACGHIGTGWLREAFQLTHNVLISYILIFTNKIAGANQTFQQRQCHQTEGSPLTALQIEDCLLSLSLHFKEHINRSPMLIMGNYSTIETQRRHMSKIVTQICGLNGLLRSNLQAISGIKRHPLLHERIAFYDWNKPANEVVACHYHNQSIILFVPSNSVGMLLNY